MEKKFKKEIGESIDNGDLDFQTKKWHTSPALVRQVTVVRITLVPFKSVIAVYPAIVHLRRDCRTNG